MTDIAISPEALQATIAETLGAKARSVTVALGEVTVVVGAADYLEAARLLRDAPGCRFEQLSTCAASTTRPGATASGKASASASSATCCRSASTSACA